MALLIVLWMLALLALVVAAFTLTSHSDIQLARNQVDAARARELADAGVTRAIVGLNDPDPTRRWIADGRPYSWRFGDGAVVISIRDEGGKINLNAAPQEALQSAFTYAAAGDDLGASLAQAVIDRRQALPGRGNTDPAFTVMEDLQTLPGMTAPIYYRATALMTVYSQSSGVNPMTASRDVLMALPNADPNEIDEFLAARAAQGTPGALPPEPPLSISRYLAEGQSSTVTIRAQATTDTGAVFIRIATITLQANGTQPFVTKAWSQEIAVP